MLEKVMQRIDDNHPMMVAWKKFKNSKEYDNTRKWALKEEHVDGSLWNAFSEGYMANTPPPMEGDIEPSPFVIENTEYRMEYVNFSTIKLTRI